MQTLKLTNFASNNIIEQTRLSAACAAAANSLTVDNAEDFTSGYLLLGAIGSKTAELLPNTSVDSGTSIALTSNTVLPHVQYDPVYSLFGNQLKIYRAPNVDGTQPSDSAFTLLDTIDIDPNNEGTLYTDASGGGNYWYKFTYFNEGDSSETDLGSSIAVRGSFTVAYCSLDEIRREAGFKYAAYVDDDQIDEKRQRAQDEINGALDEFYDTPLQPPINDFLKGITIRLAAGYLRQAQFSQNANKAVNGSDMITNAQSDLKNLVIKERVLVTKDGKSLAGVGGSGEADGWPNQTTETAAASEGGAPRVFRMSDIQGQPLSENPNGIPQGNLYYGRRY